MKKLNQLWNTSEIIVEELSDKSGYKLFTNDASFMLFVFTLPIIGNLCAFIGWVISLSRRRYIETKTEHKVIFSTAHKKT